MQGPRVVLYACGLLPIGQPFMNAPPQRLNNVLLHKLIQLGTHLTQTGAVAEILVVLFAAVLV